MFWNRGSWAAVCAATALLSLASSAYAERRGARGEEAREVEMFSAMKAGEIGVQMFPKDAKESTLVIENKTGKPLKVKLPEAFGGVPVLAQFGGGGQGGGGFGGGGQGGGGGGGQQQLGGGGGGQQGGGGFGGGGQGGGGGLFYVSPERSQKVKVPTVCLEHGKADPNPRIKYEIVPIEQVTQDASVIEICKMLGHGEVDQASAQAAAWHLTDNLSFEELYHKIGIKHFHGATEPFFAPHQVRRAMQIVTVAKSRAATAAPAETVSVVSPGESASEQ